MFLYFKGYSEFALNLSIPLLEVLQTSFCHSQNVFCPMCHHLERVRSFASRQAVKLFRCLPLTVVPRVRQTALTACSKTRNLICFSIKLKIGKHKICSLCHIIKVYLAEPFRLGMSFLGSASSCPSV